MTELKVSKRDPKANLDILKKEGNAVGVCYGSHFVSTPVSFNERDFRKVYREAGTSSLVTLGGDLAGEQCFIHDMQVHVVTGEILNVDFKIVAKGEKTTVTVPIKVVGESSAVHKKLGLLYQALHEIQVEAVPSKVPHEIEVEVTSLAEIGDTIKVADLKLGAGIDLLEDADQVVVTITPLSEEKESDNGPSMEEVLAPKAEENKEA